MYLADFLKTNLTKFAVICLSEKASKGMFLTAREAPKSRNSEDKEKRRMRKKQWPGVALLVFIIATLENSFWPKKTVRRKNVHLAIML